MIKSRAILVDIDGILANCEHRRHFVDLEDRAGYDQLWDQGTDGHWYHKFTDAKWKPDWKSFNEQMVNDTPNEWCVEIIDAFERQQIIHVYNESWTNYEDFQFLFVTGREKCFQKITMNQIYKWTDLSDNQFKLFMRPAKDHRPDTEIKREIYENHIRDKYEVIFCLDDRQSVVDLWRSLGLICLQCSEGDF